MDLSFFFNVYKFKDWNDKRIYKILPKLPKHIKTAPNLNII